jgi:hypothetical protein
MLLISVPQINNPADLDLMEQHMRALSQTGSTDFRFTVTPRLRYFPDRARVSWVRTAYLAAFAVFGWRYILQPALQPLRDQPQNPLAVTLPRLSMYNPEADPSRQHLAGGSRWVGNSRRVQGLAGHAQFHDDKLGTPQPSRPAMQVPAACGNTVAHPACVKVSGTLVVCGATV